MNLLPLALLLPLLPQDPAEAPEPRPQGQVLEDGDLVDHDYGLVFGPVLPDWILWDEEACRAAGLEWTAAMRPLYEDWPLLGLSVEATGLTDPQAYFDRVVEIEGLEAVPDSGAASEEDGFPVWQAEFLIPGEPVESGVMRVVLRDGWAIRLQFSNLQTARPTAAEMFPSLAERLRVVTTPRPRPAYPQPERRGQDWMTADGGYRTAAYGFALEPGPAWRILAGTEAEAWGDWLDAVFLHSDGREVMVYGVTVPESELADAADRWLDKRAAELEERGVASERIVLSTRFGDLKALRREDGWYFPETAVEAVLDVGPLLCVLDGWQEPGLEPSAESAVVELAESFRLLDADELEALRARLAEPGAGPARAGLDWSLRHGVYSDFATGMRLPIPAGWRARVAADPWSEPDLGLQHPELELTVTTYRYDAGEDASLSALHEASLESVLESPGARSDGPLSLEFGPARALMSEVRWQDESGEETSRIRVYDVVHEGKGLEIWVSAVDRWPAGADDALDALMTAMRFPEDGLPRQRSGDLFRDERFGWALERPSAEWRGAAEADSIGEARNQVIWSRGRHKALVAAMPATTLPDPWWGLADAVESVREDLVLNPLLAAAAEAEDTTWAGLPARRYLVEEEQLEILSLVLDGIAYVMVLSGPVDDPELRAFREAFRLWPGE